MSFDTTLITLAGAAVLLWLVSLAVKNASIMDIAWGPLFLTAAVTAPWPPMHLPRYALVVGLLALWATRLAAHVARRMNGEDPRYAAWRQQHGRIWWIRSLFQVFLLQAAIIAIITLPIQWSLTDDGPLDWRDGAATITILLGLLIEATADRQLRRHKQSGAGGILQTGLWAWSRHPNYLGEAIIWWGFWLFTFPTDPLNPQQWTPIIAPLLMTYLLRYVSGVPLLEATMKDRPGWQEYAQRTPIFLPKPPKRP